MENSSVAIGITFVLVVSLAGCSSFLGFGAGPPNHSDAATTTTSPFPKDANLAPGLTGAGVTDPEQLAFTHEQGLDGRSFTWTSTTVVTAKNGTELGRKRQAVQVGAERRLYNFSLVSAGLDGDASTTRFYRTYSNSSVSYTYFGTGDGRFDKSSGRAFLRGQFAAEDYFAHLFGAVPTNVTGTVERDGTTLYRVVGMNETRTMSFSGSMGEEVTVTNFEVTAFVDSNGRIWKITSEFDYPHDGQSARWKRTISYDEFATTVVERPAWVDEAKRSLGNRTAN